MKGGFQPKADMQMHLLGSSMHRPSEGMFKGTFGSDTSSVYDLESGDFLQVKAIDHTRTKQGVVLLIPD
jgi:hypothetical protein